MAGVAGILGVLAVLQYRWTMQISDNEHERMRTQLRTAIGQFRQDFYRDMVTASSVFQVDGELLSKHDWSRFDARYAEWAHNPANGELVTNVYIWDLRAPDGHRELQLNRQTGVFAAGTFPAEVKKVLQAEPWHAPGGALRRIAWTFDVTLPGMVRPVYRFPSGWNSGREEASGRGWRGRAQDRDRPQAQEERPPGAELVGVTVIELNSSFLVHQLFPLLVQKHLNLSGTAYHVSIFSDPGPVPSDF